ncbi:hypothetical protein SMD20_44810 [Nonomuraea sp. LP-02]|uniref:hypothetical protein n=1 Tax=Nonomuraea sp. LP-02 TaxID=3097960 RepID=UPI002E336861|nr:hypothetical protein [Nonomuraea sp. LP-02]MED7931408.1 hypothetical protein [Nonomuraea sp. LP-02]
MTAEEPLFATFDLAPLDTRGRRSWAAEQVWQTARRKRNRIALGVPRWTAKGAGEWSLELDLTLLPDEGCRFRSAELSLSLPGAVLRELEPMEIQEQETVVTERSGALRATLELPVGPLSPGVEAERASSRRTELTRTLVSLSAFGMGTSTAGWRLRLTDAREIPMSTTGMRALVSAGETVSGEIAYSVVAQIEVLTAVDRWLTAVFTPSPGGLRCCQTFPPETGRDLHRDQTAR